MFSELENKYNVKIYGPVEFRQIKQVPDNKSRVFSFVNSTELERLSVSRGVYNVLRCKNENPADAEFQQIANLLQVISTFGFEEYYQINKSNCVMALNKNSIPQLKNYSDVLVELFTAFKNNDGSKASSILKTHLNKLFELSKELGNMMDVADNKSINLNRLQQIVNELNTLRDAYTSLQKKDAENKQKAVDAVNKINGELTTTRTELETLRVESNTVKSALSKTQTDLTSAQSRIQQLNSQLSEIQKTQMSSLDQLTSTHKTEVDSLKQEYEGKISRLVKSKSEELEKAKNDYESKISNLETEKSKREAEYREISDQLVDSKFNCQQLTSQNATLTSENTSVKAINDSLSTENASLKSENANLKSQCEQIKTDAEQLKQNFETKSLATIQENTALQEQVLTLTTENTNVRAKIEDSKRQHEEELAETKEKHDKELSKIKEDYESRISEIKEDCANQISKLQEEFQSKQEVLVNQHVLELDNKQMEYQSELNKILQRVQSGDSSVLENSVQCQLDFDTKISDIKKSYEKQLEALREECSLKEARVTELEGKIEELLDGNSELENSLSQLLKKFESFNQNLTTIQVEADRKANASAQKIYNLRVSELTEQYESKISDLQAQLAVKSANFSGQAKEIESKIRSEYESTLENIKSDYSARISFLETETKTLSTENLNLKNQIQGLSQVQATTLTNQNSQQEVKLLELQSRLSNALRESERYKQELAIVKESDLSQQLEREKAKNAQLQTVVTQLHSKVPVNEERLPIYSNKDALKCRVLYIKDLCHTPVMVNIINFILEFLKTQSNSLLREVPILLYDSVNSLNIIQYKRLKVPVQYFNAGDTIKANTNVFHSPRMSKELLTKLDISSRRLIIVIDRLCDSDDLIVSDKVSKYFCVDSTSDLDLMCKSVNLLLKDFKRRCIYLSNEKSTEYLGVVTLPNKDSVAHVELRFLGRIMSDLLE